MKHSMKWCILMALAGLTVGAQEKIIEENFRDFSKKAFSSNGIQAEKNGFLSVRTDKKNHSEGIVFRKAFSLPPDDSEAKIRWSVTIGKFTDLLKPDSPKSGMRFFIVPEPLPRHLEFYILPNAIGITASPAIDGGCRISLNLKENSRDGFGRSYYSCRLKQFPVKITLDFNAKQYRLKFNQEVEPTTGNRSGNWDLSGAVWKSPLHTGARLVNSEDGRKSAIQLDAFSVETVKENL